MAQKWYVAGGGAGTLTPYSPATFKGSWNSTPAASADRLWSPYQIGTNTTVSRAETSASNPFRVCVLRAVSPTLAAQSSTGTLDMVLGLLESNSLADFYTKLYVYVTQGDSDLVRGVILDYEETSAGGGTEWPTTATGRALAAAQTIGSVSIQTGDRLVLELGYRSENTSTTSRTGTVRIGGRSSLYAPLSDLAAGSTGVTTTAGFLEFSASLALSASEPTNLTPETATAMTPLPYNSGPIDVVSSTYGLWFKRLMSAADGQQLSVFFGVDAATGNYIPGMVGAFRKSGSDYVDIGEWFDIAWQAYAIPVTIGEEWYYLVAGQSPAANPPGRNLVVSATGSSPLGTGADTVGDILITEDTSTGVIRPGAVIDVTTGEIIGYADVVPSENGVVADDGTFILADKRVATENQLVIYDVDRNVVATITTATVPQASGGQGNPPVAYDGTDFYVAQYQSGLPGILVSRISLAGIVADQWTLPLPSGWTRVTTIAVSRDSGTLFYSGGIVAEGVKRWNLVSNSALSDLVAGATNTLIADLYVLRDGTLIWAELNFVAGTQNVVHYDTAGALLRTYTYATGTYFIDHIAPGQDDPVSFVVWLHRTDPTFTDYRDFIFIRTRVSDGVALSTLSGVLHQEQGALIYQPDSEVPSTYFGVPSSCPLIVLGARASSGGGGGTGGGGTTCLTGPPKAACWGAPSPVSVKTVASSPSPTRLTSWGAADPNAVRVGLINPDSQP